MTASFIEHFSSLDDPRIDRKKLHSLMDIITLAVCAVARGADGWEAIEDFGKEKLEWLRKYIALENGVLSLPKTLYSMIFLTFPTATK